MLRANIGLERRKIVSLSIQEGKVGPRKWGRKHSRYWNIFCFMRFCTKKANGMLSIVGIQSKV